MYELGASAFQMSLFYKVCSFVIRIPEATASKMSTLNDSSRARNFLKSKDTLAYLDLAVSDITGGPVNNTTFRKVVSLDTSEEESDDQLSLRTNSNIFNSSSISMKRRKDTEDDDEEEEEIISKRKKKRRKRRKIQTCLNFNLICLFLCSLLYIYT